ncbi:MAG TPA: 2-iminoacetate synthase ThiH, partial [Actinomycetota bacterium]|nr:2-iminoacetate synthase ThiH [Actinomycetota bacterium]
IASTSSRERVQRSLGTHAPERSLADLAALLSPAAAQMLEPLAVASRELTLARFGRTMHMYAPLYLSNECLTTCGYCGFAKNLPVVRKTLGESAAIEEARHLLQGGFRSLLLLTGEHERLTGVEFLERHVRALSRIVPSIALEVQVWAEDAYRRLRDAGTEAVVIYQETYEPSRYLEVHLAGRKRDYRWRLLGPERAARAGIRRVGLGALLGLHDDWRFEALVTAAHARWLMKSYWRTQVTVSVPRLRPSASGFQPRVEVSDPDLVQLVAALRLALPDAGLVLSTREGPELRDGLHRIGITHTSAGSHTEPGGYEHPREAEEQFEIADHRSPAEVADSLRRMGLDPVWEDPSTPAGVTRAVARGAP